MSIESHCTEWQKKRIYQITCSKKNIHTVLCCIQDLLWEARSSAPPSLEFLFSIAVVNKWVHEWPQCKNVLGKSIDQQIDWANWWRTDGSGGQGHRLLSMYIVHGLNKRVSAFQAQATPQINVVLMFESLRSAYRIRGNILSYTNRLLVEALHFTLVSD